MTEAPEITRSVTKKGTVYTCQLDYKVERPAAHEDTLPKNFLLRVEELGDHVAMRKKRFGIWQEYTWNEVYRRVHDFCLGLVSLGLKQGESLAIIGDNDPEFYWAQIAAHSARAMSCGVFSDAGPQELLYAIHKSDSVFVLARDQEQVDKALEIRDKVPNIRKVIYWDDNGMWNYQDSWLGSFEDIEALGREYGKQNPGLFEQLVSETQPDDVIILSASSGTTGLPKLAMVTNWRLLFGERCAMPFASTYRTDNWLSFSPMAWIAEQAFGYTPFMVRGQVVNFPEGPMTVQHDIREIAPAGILFPSRVWENLASTVRVRINDSYWINRALYDFFLPLAYQVIDLENAKKSIPPHLKLARWLGEWAVFQPLRDKIGLVNARNAFTGGAALSPDVIRFFRAVGVELRQVYGSTETQCTIHKPGDVKVASVGIVMPSVDVKIADEDREILIRTEAMFAGYYKDPEQTAEAIDEEGWYHTGDAGYMDEDGHLIYLDRVKDMIQLANGESFSPQFIEGRLKFSPYVQDVMAVGGFDMEFVTAIVNIDFENVARWAEKNRISFTTFVDLSQKPEVYDLIKRDVEQVNQTLPPAARIKKFVILHKAFDADEAELTRTRKLRRHALQQKYGDMLEAMYGDRDQVLVKAEVKYRDGRTGLLETAVRVCQV
jgi:long-chain acyl-CoA synthetase